MSYYYLSYGSMVSDIATPTNTKFLAATSALEFHKRMDALYRKVGLTRLVGGYE